jgi:hypothetical protein
MLALFKKNSKKRCSNQLIYKSVAQLFHNSMENKNSKKCSSTSQNKIFIRNKSKPLIPAAQHFYLTVWSIKICEYQTTTLDWIQLYFKRDSQPLNESQSYTEQD